MRGDKKRRRFGAALLCAALMLSMCAADGGRMPAARAEGKTPASETSAEASPESSARETDRLRVAVGSDLHLDPDNTDKSLGSEVVYSPELVEALLWDAREQGAGFILLTGDICNGGKRHKHEALIEKLRQAEADGLPVYVLPGNHDLAPLRQTEFAELYADFGYDEAFSRDPSSLSYCVIRDGLMLLMMDTGGYSFSVIDLAGAPDRENSEPFLSDATLAWAEEMLREARTQGLTVLAAGHYNLLPEISRQPGSGYCIENGDRFRELLREFGVPLYLSGHMHTRYVYQEDGLTELLTEYLLGYPTGYSLLDLTGRSLRYTPRRIDVDAWAAATGERDPVLLNFHDWQQEGLYNYSVSNIEYMSQRNPISQLEKGDATGFFYTVMNAFWDGSLSEKRAAVERMPGYEPFFRCAEGYAYGWWLKNLIETASPLLKGFELTF